MALKEGAKESRTRAKNNCSNKSGTNVRYNDGVRNVVQADVIVNATHVDNVIYVRPVDGSRVDVESDADGVREGRDDTDVRNVNDVNVVRNVRHVDRVRNVGNLDSVNSVDSSVNGINVVETVSRVDNVDDVKSVRNVDKVETIPVRATILSSLFFIPYILVLILLYVIDISAKQGSTLKYFLL